SSMGSPWGSRSSATPGTRRASSRCSRTSSVPASRASAAPPDTSIRWARPSAEPSRGPAIEALVSRAPRADHVSAMWRPQNGPLVGSDLSRLGLADPLPDLALDHREGLALERLEHEGDRQLHLEGVVL